MMIALDLKRADHQKIEYELSEPIFWGSEF